ncbi:MAG: 16S rRNA (cytidine(1402)-2'-O)-methyltransferase [Candidatus Aminicenantes bacterium]|nr:16S rRNA (cytidine(1402)-2'-O)-methyltransferase [Candidatus Aminicenantes bacterium]
MSGTLYLVATPLGNLEDLTLRAVRILKEADLVACEDTRRTSILLRRYGLRKELLSYYEPREGRKIPLIIGRLKGGGSVALVSDGGTPAISDPGFRLVREAVKEGIAVVPVPGPTAAVAALSASGLPTDRFLFLGFAPPKAEALRKTLLSAAAEPGTIIFYVPARRVVRLLEAVLDTLGDRPVVIARELTKVYEEFIRGSAMKILTGLRERNLKGEVTFLIGGAGKFPK